MDSLSFGDLSAAGIRLAIVVSRFNESITGKLLDGALDAVGKAGATVDPEVVRVPGAWELPLAAKRAAATGRYDAVICLGAVIRGDTPHFDYVAGECARGLQQVQQESGIPIVFGVLTTDNLAQAEARTGGEHGNKGADAALTAVEMVHVLRAIGNKS